MQKDQMAENSISLLSILTNSYAIAEKNSQSHLSDTSIPQQTISSAKITSISIIEDNLTLPTKYINNQSPINHHINQLNQFSISSNKKKKQYKILTKDQKWMIIKRSLETSISQASHKFNVCQNNIIRWIKRIQRKVGAGRKINDSEMEKSLIQWIQNQEKKQLTNKIIRCKARLLSKNPSFKASKGWYQRFIKRNSDIINLKKPLININMVKRQQQQQSAQDAKLLLQFKNSIKDKKVKKQSTLRPQINSQPIFMESQSSSQSNNPNLRSQHFSCVSLNDQNCSLLMNNNYIFDVLNLEKLQKTKYMIQE